jgi:hypothetical protein
VPSNYVSRCTDLQGGSKGAEQTTLSHSIKIDNNLAKK